MFYYKLNIQYNGTQYKGFQFQKELKTIQGEINLAISKILSTKFTTMSGSRTDTGVHALDQTLKLTSSLTIEPVSFLVSLNQFLPEDIRCCQIEHTSWDFKPNSNLFAKDYFYLFTNDQKHHQHPFIYNISKPLNIKHMQECCEIILGEKDFKNFCATGSNVKTTKRIVYKCHIRKINSSDIALNNSLFFTNSPHRECFIFEISANGFLKQMIRNIVSVLWLVGSEKIAKEDFTQLLNGEKISQKFWRPAPSNGLFLKKINYL